MFGLAANANAVDSGFEAMLASPDRPALDRELDATRKPGEVMEFLGVESGSTALDVLTFGGWYAEVLSAAVGPTGRVIAHNADRYLRSELYAGVVEESRARVGRLSNVELYFQSIPDLEIDGRVDTVLIALRLRDAYIYGGEQTALRLLGEMYDVLKPGGTLGVIDYVGIAGRDNKQLVRIEKETVRRLLTETGFEIESESAMLANPGDDHDSVVVSPLDPDSSVLLNTSRTDRMLIRARRPLH